MTDVIIHDHNETHVRFECSDGLAYELFEFLSFEVEIADFVRQKRKGWDGRIRLFQLKRKLVYKGLIPFLKSHLKSQGYTYEDKSSIAVDSSVTREDILKHFNNLGLPDHIELRDYQIDAVYEAVKEGRRLIISSTSSGKSLIIYALLTWYGLSKTLVIVPRTSLVEQLYKDFYEYGFEGTISRIYDGADDKNDIKQITISTWQSINAMKDVTTWINQFDIIVDDEVHQADAKALKKIMEKAIDVPHRFGTTGTLKDATSHILVLIGLFGNIYEASDYKQLMDEGYISTLSIVALQLIHSNPEDLQYHDEVSYIIGCEARNQFIVNLISRLRGNTMVLFDRKETHGHLLYDMCIKAFDGDDDIAVLYIDGDIDVADREAIREFIDNSDKRCILLASYGTSSTGINIKSLEHLVSAHTFKAKIRNLQTIGRGLRKTDKHTHCTWWDLSDNFKFSKRHLIERLKLYKREGFDMKIKSVRL